MTTASTRAILETPHAPGAIAVIALHGDVVALVSALTGRVDWPQGRCRLVTIADIDDAIVVVLDSSRAYVMPHGGPRIVQRIFERLASLGVVVGNPTSIDPFEAYPEAADRLEAIMLATLARAESPLAIDLLLDQPRRWRAAMAAHTPGGSTALLSPEDLARSARLDRLVSPPRVVLVGRANIGKSTLTNTLAGRHVALTADQPGTTRDHVGVMLDLDGLVIHWHDTPGMLDMRGTHDAIEREAQAIASRLVESADLVIAAADAAHDWPELARSPNLRVALRADLGARIDADCVVCSTTGAGLPELFARVREALVPADALSHPGPWLFDERLLGAGRSLKGRSDRRP